MKSILVAISFTILVCAVGARADNPNQLSVHVGPRLVAKSSRILQTSGARFGYGLRRGTAELSAFMANEGGVSYHVGTIGWKKSFPMDQISPHFLTGFDFHFLRRLRDTEYRRGGGWHLGFGFEMQASPQFAIRNDYIRHLGYRNSLSAVVSMVYSFSPVDEGGGTSIKASSRPGR